MVKESGGTVVRLGEIADVVLGAETYEEDVRFNGETAVFMGIWVLPTANTLDVIAAVRAAMPEIQAQLPAGMIAGIPYDSTVYIENAIDEVLKTLAETLLIVVIVIFLFLGSLRAVVIPRGRDPDLADRRGLPHAGLRLHHQPADPARDRALGRTGGRRRHRHGRERRAPPREGLRPLQAALVAARELVGPIIAMTITLAAVYTPVALQGGLTGALFREFAFTLAGAVIVSGVVALTLSPMMGVEAAARRRHRARLRGLGQPALRGRPPDLHAAAR